jgi:O-acetyl-ADP-ribose deacetylase
MRNELDMKIDIVRGDITKLEVDAIVNAANTTLLGGGGVDGAIHRAAGPELLAECRMLGGCEPGRAKITRGYRLPARFVIHTVGPIWRGGKHEEAETLVNCYRNSLRLAMENGIKTIAFPAISCGAYGYPIQAAVGIALKTAREFLANTDKIDKVIFVLWSEEIYEVYRQALKK